MRATAVAFAISLSGLLIDWLVVVPWTGADTCDSECTSVHVATWIVWAVLAWSSVLLAVALGIQLVWRAVRARKRR